ncbi:DUF6415 family natural product biosynthesis protein [Streptomyces chartreusis]|uniref:DUF6415 family natural product biosynthesis protein n=1 Tax=Streptomyces chartreusis TaxID=1969 RepID=UPI0036B8ACA1
MSATESTSLDTARLRAYASWFTAQTTLPRHPTTRAYETGLREALGGLIPQIEKHAAERQADDVPGKVALAGVGEARRRMGIPERNGLKGEFERVKRLAMSVSALCDHLDALTGARMCLLCDRALEEAGANWVPYDRAVPIGGVKSGHVHAACAKAVQR